MSSLASRLVLRRGGRQSPWMRIVGTATAEVASGNLTIADVAASLGYEPQAGDLMVATIGYRGNAAFTLPAGWSLVSAQQSAGNTTAGTTASKASGLMAYIIRGASAPSLIFTRTGGDVAQGIITLFRRVDGANAVYDTGSDNVLTVASVVATTGSIVTAAPDELVVAMCSVARNSSATAGFLAASDMQIDSGIVTGLPLKPTPLSFDKFDYMSNSGTSTGADVRTVVAAGVKRRAGPTGTIQLTTGASALHVMIAGAFKALSP